MTGLALVLAIACEGPEPAIATRPVPGAWREVRSSAGHTRHLAKRVECRDCHADVEYRDVRLGACAACHAVSGERAGKLGAEVVGIEGLHAKGAWVGTSTVHVRDAQCFECHDFRGAARAPWDCVRCHASTEGHAPQIAVHTGDTCRACHQPHRARVVSGAPCTGCHPSAVTTHGHGLDPDACTGCHLPHRPKSEARTRCASCHESRPPIVARDDLLPKHGGCLSCHPPHVREVDASSERASEASSAREVDASSAREVDASSARASEASSAREANASGTAPAERSSRPEPVLGVRCDRCHSYPALSHGATAHDARPAERCIGCHPPHSKNGTIPVGTPRPCASCHGMIAKEGVAHARSVACTTCHAPHRFDLKSTGALCVSCHDVRSANAHPDCLECHAEGAHAPRKGLPKCDRCHTEEAHGAPAGHALCRQCHERHGRVKTTEAACERCHFDKLDAPHGNLEKGCMTCHAPHERPKPPRCSSCHLLQDLPALHRISGHDRCAVCHTMHGPARAERERCISCHNNRAEHQPDAHVCTGCHPFARSH